MPLMYVLRVRAQLYIVVELQELDGEPVLPPQRGSFASSHPRMPCKVYKLSHGRYFEEK